MPDKYRERWSQPTLGLSTGSPVEELYRGLKELKEFLAPEEAQNMKNQ